MSKFQLIALVISLLWFVTIFELVRRKKIIGGYSLVWLFSGIILIIFALWENLLLKITHFLDLVYPPSTFFALVLVFLTLVTLDLTVKLSALSKKNKEIAQRLALLNMKNAKKQKKKS